MQVITSTPRAARAAQPPDILVAVLALMPREQVARLAQAAVDALDLGHDPDADGEPDTDAESDHDLI